MFTKPFVLVTAARIVVVRLHRRDDPAVAAADRRTARWQRGRHRTQPRGVQPRRCSDPTTARPLRRAPRPAGRRWSAGALLASAATAVCTVVDSRWGLLPLRCLQGVGEASLFVGAATSISDLAPPGRGAEAASYFSVAVFGGLGIGPVISEFVIGTDNFDAGLWVAAGFAALASVLATFAPKGLRHHHDDEAAPRAPRYHPAAIAPGSRAGVRHRWLRHVQRVHARLLRSPSASMVPSGCSPPTRACAC